MINRELILMIIIISAGLFIAGLCFGIYIGTILKNIKLKQR